MAEDRRRTPADSPLPTMDRLTKQVARGGGIVLVGRVLIRVLSFGLQLLLSNMLGASSYGLYSLGVNVVQWLQQISQLGLANGVVRFVAMYRAGGDTQRVKGTILGALIIVGITSILCACVLLLFAAPISEQIFHSPLITPYLRWMALGLPVIALFFISQSILRGFQRITEMVSVGLLRSVLQIMIAAGAFLMGLRIGGAVAAFLLSALIAFLWGLRRIQRLQPEFLKDAVLNLRGLLRFSIPVYFAGMSYVLMSRLDLLMIGYFLNPSSAGYYRAAVSVASLVNFLLGAINTAFAPMISQLFHKGNLRELEHLYKTVTRWTFMAALFGCLVVVTLAEPLLDLFGTGFATAASCLILLSLAQLINAAVGSVGFLLQMSGRQDWLLINNLATASLNVGLNLWLIPRWGLIGAATATGVSLSLNNLLGLLEVWVFFRLHPWNLRYLQLAAAGAIALMVGFLIPDAAIPWPMSLAAMGGSYGGVILLLGLGPEDRLILDAFRRKIQQRGGR